MQNVLIGDKGKPRLIAMMVDNLLATFLGLIVVVSLPIPDNIVRGVTLCLVYLAYFFASEALWGRSVGKFITGLMVCGLDGSRCDWRQAAIRTSLRLVETNPLLAGAIPGGLCVVWTARRQRLGDILAGTVVVAVGTTGHSSATAESRPDV